MGIAIIDATRLAKINKVAYEVLIGRHATLQKRCDKESAAQEKTRQSCQDKGLIPFRDIFCRIKNVDLAELASFDQLPAGALPNAEVQKVRLTASGAVSSLAGGAAAGAAVGAATFAAVGTFAAASTGAAISGLSGAAAYSATLAWLGGGSLAAGGGGMAAGTMVLTGLVATPVVLALGGFLEYKGRQQRRKQEETAAALRKAAAELKLAETKADAVIKRGKQIRGVLRQFRGELVDRLPGLELLVANNDDYATYKLSDRRQVADSVSLVTTLITVMSAKFVDAKGQVTDLSANVVKDAKLRMDDLLAA